jgi:hypothetical protein
VVEVAAMRVQGLARQSGRVIILGNLDHLPSLVEAASSSVEGFSPDADRAGCRKTRAEVPGQNPARCTARVTDHDFFPHRPPYPPRRPRQADGHRRPPREDLAPWTHTVTARPARRRGDRAEHREPACDTRSTAHADVLRGMARDRREGDGRNRESASKTFDMNHHRVSTRRLTSSCAGSSNSWSKVPLGRPTRRPTRSRGLRRAGRCPAAAGRRPPGNASCGKRRPAWAGRVLGGPIVATGRPETSGQRHLWPRWTYRAWRNATRSAFSWSVKPMEKRVL